MVIQLTSKSTRGSMMVELLVAIALLTGALLPIAYSFASEKRMVRAAYHRAAAMEIVDAETEILAAGEWKNFERGTHEYKVAALAATNLPQGRFLLTIEPKKFSLTWQPASKPSPTVVREVTLP
jgi:hypothetical protein